MTVGNYVRLFLGWLSPSLSGCCGQALCLEARPCPPDPPVPSTQVGPRVLLCWRAPSLPCVRYKILPAWLLGGENGTKLSLHVEKAPNRAISGELGEFCTGSGAVRLVLGEFCTAHAVGRGVLGEFCTGSGAARLVLGEFCPAHAVRGVCWESFVPKRRGVVLVGRDLFRRGTFRVCSCRASATHRCPILALGLCSALDTGGGGGFAALGAGCRRVAGVSRL